MTGPVRNQCVTGTGLAIFGFGLHFYDAGEIIMSLLLSGIVILFLGLVLLSGFLIWQGGKRIAALVGPWNSADPPYRPAVLTVATDSAVPH